MIGRTIPVALAIVTFLGLGSPGHGREPPLAGEWEVVKVLVNQSLTRTVGYAYDDPRLRHRVLRVAPEAITFDAPEQTACERPTWTGFKTTAGELWSHSFAPGVADAEPVTLEDYDAPLKPGQAVNVAVPQCGSGSGGWGPPREQSGSTWIVEIGDGRIALRWYDQTLLLLRRLPSDSLPDPSFPCGKATSITEWAICASRSLSGLDRSISDAYGAASKSAKELGSSRVRSLVASHRRWLSERDACGASQDCLERTMRRYLDRLAAEAD